MNYLFQQRFFRLLSECLQHQVPASELIKAIEELATHIADFSINEQDYNILLRYFSFGFYPTINFDVFSLTEVVDFKSLIFYRLFIATNSNVSVNHNSKCYYSFAMAKDSI